MANNQYEESFTATLWQFLPGIIKFVSAIALIGIVFNVFNLVLQANNKVGEDYKFQADLIRDYDYHFGKKEASLKYIYFYDLQCPFCKQNNITIKQLKDEYKDKVDFVYKNFPLDTLHVYAKSAALGAMAANKQNKFIEFVDGTYDKQDAGLGADKLEAIAKNTGLDLEQWNKDKQSKEIKQQVEYDQRDGTTIELPFRDDGQGKQINKINATPTSVLMKDGKVVDWFNGLPIDQLREKLNKNL